MKILSALIFSLFAFSTFAGLYPECDETKKIVCKATYYSLNEDNERTTAVENRNANYEIINWDEPSVAYCLAEVAFNKYGMYITASLSVDNDITLYATRTKEEGNYGQDHFHASGSVNKKGEFSALFGLSPVLSTGVYSVEVNCKITK